MHRLLYPLVALGLILTACKGNQTRDDQAHTTQPADDAPVMVRVIGLNDLHGHIEGPSGSVKVAGEKLEAGGVDAMAAHLEKLRAQTPYTSFVCAGDLVGASPLISALFHDEPTIEAMNKLGLDVLAVGNHEFDEGVEELLRLQNGGCHPEDGCTGKETFEGAKFPFLAANVIVKETGETLFAPYLVKEYGPVKIGYIGLTLEGTPDVVSPEGVRSVDFLDEAEVINKHVAELEAQGVHTIVVVIHEGGTLTERTQDINECPGLSGPIVEINKKLAPTVDAIVAGHTHKAFNCTIDGRLLTSAKSYGRLLTQIDLTIDPKTNEVIEKKATNVAITRDVELDTEMTAHIESYRALVGPLANQQIGTLEADITRAPNEHGYSQLGGMIADAQLAATNPANMGGAQLAFMNQGGVRNDLMFGDDQGIITFEELHSVQPFGNTLVVLEMTGAQIEALLEQQWQADKTSILQPSANVSYSWSDTAGDHIAPEDVMIDGAPLALDATYRVTVNSFLASGGDGFSLLQDAKQVSGGPVDLDVFVDYIKRTSPLRVEETSRITKK